MAEQKPGYQNSPPATPALIVLAGATGDLGARIAQSLLQQGATVRALIRLGNTKPAVAALREQGATLMEVDFSNAAALTQACAGAACVVSALSGLREVIVDAQTQLLTAAVAAGVPRFIPSDYSIDYPKLAVGTNRNLDLRCEFNQRLDQAPIRAHVRAQRHVHRFTNRAGAGRAVWPEADPLLGPLDFTAAAALDPTMPCYLRVAGEVASIRNVQTAASAATGQPFGLFWAGGMGVLSFMTKATRVLIPASDNVFPPWQGMQYLHNMFSGRPKLAPLDNARYPDIRWTSVREVLASKEVKA